MMGCTVADLRLKKGTRLRGRASDGGARMVGRGKKAKELEAGRERVRELRWSRSCAEAILAVSRAVCRDCVCWGKRRETWLYWRLR